MKKLSIIIFSLFILSCSSSGVDEMEIKENSQFKLVQFLLDFKNRNPTWTNNEITTEKIDKVFSKELEDFYGKNKSCLSELKYTLESVNKYKNGKYIARFSNRNRYVAPYESISIDLIAIVDSELISILKVDSIYSLDIEFIKLLKLDASNYIDSIFFNLSTGHTNSVGATYSLGTPLVKLNKLNGNY